MSFVEFLKLLTHINFFVLSLLINIASKVFIYLVGRRELIFYIQHVSRRRLLITKGVFVSRIKFTILEITFPGTLFLGILILLK